jgi:DnaK suppressor protein
MPPRQAPEDPRELLARLEAEAEAEAARLRTAAAAADDRGDGHHHPAEAATDADLKERELALQLRVRQRQEQIRLAREALAEGTYGVCLDCGGPIPEARLAAVPDAVRCVPCQSAAGRRR